MSDPVPSPPGLKMAGMSQDEDCPTCGHLAHTERCDHPITEDIRVGAGPYDPVGSFYRSMIVDTCGCGSAVVGR